MRVTKGQIATIVKIFSENTKALTKDEVFEKFFGERYSESTADKMYSSRAKWTFIRRLMKAIRKKSPYFVVGEAYGLGKWRYSMVRTEEQGAQFKNRMASIRKGILYIEKRCDDYLDRMEKGVVIATQRKKKKKMK